jgi:predicted permease
MDAVANAALPIFALILTGYICSIRRILGPSATESLNNFVVWLALPALLFQATAQMTFDQINHPSFIAAIAAGMALTFLLSFALARPREHRIGRRLADKTIESLDASYANTGFMGIPLALVTFGDAGLAPAILATILTACVLFAAAIVIIEMDLQQGSYLLDTLRKLCRSLARNPLLVAPLLGAAYATTRLPLPAPLLRFTTLLGNAATPCALVTIGLFLAQTRGGRDLPTVLRLVGLKLLVQPAITAAFAFGVFSMPPLWSHSALLLSALPIGTGPFMLAKLYNREAGVTSRAILLSTMLSVITISLLIAWFGQV